MKSPIAIYRVPQPAEESVARRLLWGQSIAPQTACEYYGRELPFATIVVGLLTPTLLILFVLPEHNDLIARKRNLLLRSRCAGHAVAATQFAYMFIARGYGNA